MEYPPATASAVAARPSVAPAVSVTLPDISLTDLAAPTAFYCRRFHRPTSLGDNDRVTLVSDLLPLASSVLLNGVCVQASITGDRLQLTGQLLPFNELVLQIDQPNYAAASCGTACLLIG